MNPSAEVRRELVRDDAAPRRILREYPGRFTATRRGDGLTRFVGVRLGDLSWVDDLDHRRQGLGGELPDAPGSGP